MKSSLTASFLVLFFLKMPKNWVGRTTLNGEKKEDGLIVSDETTHCGIRLTANKNYSWH